MKETEESIPTNSLIPRLAMLDDWSSNTWMNGVQIEELRELDTISVATMHHTYEITIVNPNIAEVLVRGGEFFPERTAAFVLGASMGGSFLKLHGIYAGLKLELQAGGRRIITSPVRDIAILKGKVVTNWPGEQRPSLQSCAPSHRLRAHSYATGSRNNECRIGPRHPLPR